MQTKVEILNPKSEILNNIKYQNPNEPNMLGFQVWANIVEMSFEF